MALATPTLHKPERRPRPLGRRSRGTTDPMAVAPSPARFPVPPDAAVGYPSGRGARLLQAWEGSRAGPDRPGDDAGNPQVSVHGRPFESCGGAGCEGGRVPRVLVPDAGGGKRARGRVGRREHGGVRQLRVEHVRVSGPTASSTRRSAVCHSVASTVFCRSASCSSCVSGRLAVSTTSVPRSIPAPADCAVSSAHSRLPGFVPPRMMEASYEARWGRGVCNRPSGCAAARIASIQLELY